MNSSSDKTQPKGWMHQLLPTTWESLVSLEPLDTANAERRARLLIRFGILGGVFGIFYGLFYLFIGYSEGCKIVFGCVAIFLSIPTYFFKRFGLRFSSNLLMATLVVGFTLLTMIEGGMDGHAIAWFCAIPLCGLLLCKIRTAVIWGLVTIGTVAFFGAAHLSGYQFPEVYPESWHHEVDAIGYLGLVPFLALLGYIFEFTRRNAFARLNESNEALIEANELLRELNREKSEILTIAAQDLKDPLSVVAFHGDLVKQVSDLEDLPLLSKHITESVERMLETVGQLLEVRSLEDGETVYEIERCDVHGPLMEAIHKFGHRAAEKQIRLNILNHFNSLPAVLANTDALVRVFENILSNAIKYSESATTIKIGGVSDENQLTLTISDEGPGLSDVDQLRLFEKFGRLTPIPSFGETNHGIGLWLAQRIAREMNAEIFCESKPDEGCTFGIRLMLWDDSNEAVFPSHHRLTKDMALYRDLHDTNGLTRMDGELLAR